MTGDLSEAARTGPQWREELAVTSAFATVTGVEPLSSSLGVSLWSVRLYGAWHRAWVAWS